MERLPGFRDFYPEPVPHEDLWSADTRQHIFDHWRRTARRYGFREYDGPPLEPLELFTTKSGAEIIGQLYNFKDKGERDVSLRPEMTPTLARMVAAHERSYKKPIKWFAIPQLFRYERQQKGRLREHFQLNADIIGETDSAADAELMALLIDTLRALGLTETDIVLRLSSRNAWHDFFHRHHGDPAKEYDFYQVIDKLEREAPETNEQKLRGLGFSVVEVMALIDEAKPTTELQLILDNLSARGLSDFVKVDYGVIRGLAYYTGIVFEAFDRKGDQPRAIAGGGRYDNLVKLISGGKVDLPALGFGMGDVVLAELLKSRKLLPEFHAALDAFCIIEDEALRPETLKFIQDLRSAGLCVDYSLTRAKPDKQFKRAQELKAARTVALGRNAAGELVVKTKDLETRQERILGRAEAIGDLLRTP
ncbi:MAG TPA: histidine--tRNA ligase [Verrucomicrobiae bacterium]|nr:histidine--tRNA ligase [Verrucomicrobiae bacterium]